MDKTLTIVDTPSTSGGSVLSLRERIQNLMQSPTADQLDAGRQPDHWRIDGLCDPDAPSLAHAGMQFEDQ